MTSCEACVSANITHGCKWCEKLARCSDGIDRFHQEWFGAGCPITAVNVTCPKPSPKPSPLPAVLSPNSTTKMMWSGTTSKGGINSSSNFTRKATSAEVSQYSTTPGKSRQTQNTDPNSVQFGDRSRYTILQSNGSHDLANNVPISGEYVAVASEGMTLLEATFLADRAVWEISYYARCAQVINIAVLDRDRVMVSNLA